MTGEYEINGRRSRKAMRMRTSAQDALDSKPAAAHHPMTGSERLKAVQEKLIAAGVVDVKPFLDPDAFKKFTLDEVCGHLADFLESWLRGDFKVVNCIGDAPKHHVLTDAHGYVIEGPVIATSVTTTK